MKVSLSLVHTVILTGKCLQNDKDLVTLYCILHKHLKKAKTIISSKGIIHIHPSYAEGANYLSCV